MGFNWGSVPVTPPFPRPTAWARAAPAHAAGREGNHDSRSSSVSSPGWPEETPAANSSSAAWGYQRDHRADVSPKSPSVAPAGSSSSAAGRSGRAGASSSPASPPTVTTAVGKALSQAPSVPAPANVGALENATEPAVLGATLSELRKYSPRVLPPALTRTR